MNDAGTLKSFSHLIFFKNKQYPACALHLVERSIAGPRFSRWKICYGIWKQTQKINRCVCKFAPLWCDCTHHKKKKKIYVKVNLSLWAPLPNKSRIDPGCGLKCENAIGLPPHTWSYHRLVTKPPRSIINLYVTSYRWNPSASSNIPSTWVLIGWLVNRLSCPVSHLLPANSLQGQRQTKNRVCIFFLNFFPVSFSSF